MIFFGSPPIRFIVSRIARGLTYAQITRPRSTREFWRRRYVQLGVPYLVWTGIYWVYTLLSTGGSWGQAGSLLWHDVVFGYYQLYFAVVLFQLYAVLGRRMGRQPSANPGGSPSHPSYAQRVSDLQARGCAK